ncbi:unnamed protein product [Adineta ricciae]|uniref:NAD(P)(+)--arginine ADP-ribosyltransferase n=3 Tax=Adineta ricciae TaxID=249248 RepID=A0A814XF06_ADIRI|nr:unnamed protein product [Adineta ricciae]
MRRQIVLRSFLVWLSAEFNLIDKEYQHAYKQLCNLFNGVYNFTEANECMRFLQQYREDKVFMIISGCYDEDVVHEISSFPQVEATYIIYDRDSRYHEQMESQVKSRGIFTKIEEMCNRLQVTVKKSNQDSIAMSFTESNEDDSIVDLNRLEPSFMHTQLLKSALFDIEHTQEERQYFVSYCKKANISSPQMIEEFDEDYRPDKAIWWYSRDCFIYGLLNESLRLLKANIIVNMGFFVYDTHKQIERIHQQQLSQYKEGIFTVYRGQSLNKRAFEKLRKSKGGLISFNNFLSTSKIRDIAHFYAQITSQNDDNVGILFIMIIDTKLTSTPFADIQDISYFNNEAEVLFSMHTVFRIGQIAPIGANERCFEVQLTLTDDSDQQLGILMTYLEEDARRKQGWDRIGSLLINIGQLEKAEDLYDILLEKSSDRNDQSVYYHQLGIIKNKQSEYREAARYYAMALDIRRETLPESHPELASSYNSIGEMYQNIGEYSTALSYCEKSLQIRQQTHPENRRDLAISYNNIGEICSNMGEYAKALSYHEKSLRLRQEFLPENHQDLAISYNNIGEIYKRMGEYAKALSSHEKALNIKEKVLPENHSSFGITYSNIGSVYDGMGEYSKALSCYEKDLKITKTSLPENHPDLAVSYNNIGLVYYNMKEYSKALFNNEMALSIQQKSLPENHPHIATSYNNVAIVYETMGQYSKALIYYEKALRMRKNILSDNHPDLATTYNNIGVVYLQMGEYAKALMYSETALKIQENILSRDHPDLATTYGNIGWVYNQIGEYSKALYYCEKDLEISKRSLPDNHPHLATAYNKTGESYYNTKDYSKALYLFQQAEIIWKQSLPTYHLQHQKVLESIELTQKML